VHAVRCAAPLDHALCTAMATKTVTTSRAAGTGMRSVSP
jgi:hypothetical protein